MVTSPYESNVRKFTQSNLQWQRKEAFDFYLSMTKEEPLLVSQLKDPAYTWLGVLRVPDTISSKQVLHVPLCPEPPARGAITPPSRWNAFRLPWIKWLVFNAEIVIVYLLIWPRSSLHNRKVIFGDSFMFKCFYSGILYYVSLIWLVWNNSVYLEHSSVFFWTKESSTPIIAQLHVYNYVKK